MSLFFLARVPCYEINQAPPCVRSIPVTFVHLSMCVCFRRGFLKTLFTFYSTFLCEVYLQRQHGGLRAFLYLHVHVL